MIALTCAKETGAKSVLSIPTSYCVGRSILTRNASFPVLFLQVRTYPKSCQMPSYEPAITKEWTVIQINFLFIHLDIHLHRYLFEVFRVILPQILDVVVAGNKIYFPRSACSVH